MVIDTKFNLRDELYYLKKGSIVTSEVVFINIYENQVIYGLRDDSKRESEVFGTAAEAAESWLSQQGLTLGVKNVTS